MPLTTNQVNAKLYELADETGVAKETAHWVLSSIARQAAGTDDGSETTGHSSAFRLCRQLVLDLDERYPGRVVEVLRDCGINSSRDVGRIVFALVDKGLARAEEGDDPEDFGEIFDLQRFDDFLADAGITLRKVDAARLTRRIAWSLYVVGGVLIVASYLRIVSGRLGWIGWCIGMAGWGMFQLRCRRRRARS